MRTIRTKVYKFNELSKTAKANAIEKCWDYNVSEDWWTYTYEDAERIGLKITGFDIDRASYVKAEFMEGASETANLILKEHGQDCETFKTASAFLVDWDNLVAKHSDGKNLEAVAEDNEYEFDKEAEDLEEEFLKSLCEDYRIILQKEYEYLTSEQAIIETIEANGYEFTKDGNQI